MSAQEGVIAVRRGKPCAWPTPSWGQGGWRIYICQHCGFLLNFCAGEARWWQSTDSWWRHADPPEHSDDGWAWMMRRLEP